MMLGGCTAEYAHLCGNYTVSADVCILSKQLTTKVLRNGPLALVYEIYGDNTARFQVVISTADSADCFTNNAFAYGTAVDASQIWQVSLASTEFLLSDGGSATAWTSSSLRFTCV